jgi:hypothetical protein
MQYLLLLYGDEKRWGSMSQEQYKAVVAEYQAFGKEFAGTILGSNPLQHTDTARTVRVRDGIQVNTDGPFAETKEQLGGYYLIDVPDIDKAAEIAARVPAARYGSVEVRPIRKIA